MLPTDTPTTYEKIKRISYCEDYILANTDCEIVKVRDNAKFGIIEVDNLDEIIKENKYNQINDELKRQGFKKVALDLSQIDDDEYIAIDYDNSSFSYKLNSSVFKFVLLSSSNNFFCFLSILSGITTFKTTYKSPVARPDGLFSPLPLTLCLSPV